MAMDDGMALLPPRTPLCTHLRTALLVLNCLLLALPAALLLFEWGALLSAESGRSAPAAALVLAVCFLLCFLSAWMGLTPPAAEAWALAGTGCAALALYPRPYLQTHNRLLAYAAYQLMLMLAAAALIPAWNRVLYVEDLETNRASSVVFIACPACGFSRDALAPTANNGDDGAAEELDDEGPIR
ncbi:hypothetical protein C8R46DRAFT_1214584 [Mycena filopes]|nr:hypothetical protein C8R46DRAFT_1214584 [Mycena filopes]